MPLVCFGKFYILLPRQPSVLVSAIIVCRDIKLADDDYNNHTLTVILLLVAIIMVLSQLSHRNEAENRYYFENLVPTATQLHNIFIFSLVLCCISMFAYCFSYCVSKNKPIKQPSLKCQLENVEIKVRCMQFVLKKTNCPTFKMNFVYLYIQKCLTHSQDKVI